MKIIINQNKELRFVGYDESVGCNPLEVECYISKSLNPQRPIHFVIDNRFHLLMYQNEENDNYKIYKPFDLMNIKYNEGYKKIKITFNNEESEEKELYFFAFEDKSLLKYVGKEV